MKKVRHIINTIVWTLIGLYVVVMVMVNIPMIQSVVGSKFASMMSRKLGTEVHIGKVSVGFFNRVVIDDVSILDQNGQNLLRSTRMSAKLSYVALVQGDIIVTSAQLFGLNANLYKANAKGKTNFQFVIDSLKSKDTTSQKAFSMAINSLIIRHGKITWNHLDKPKKALFDPHHINLSNISSHIIINTLGNDSINVNIKNLALKEASGIQLNSLSIHAAANKDFFSISNLHIALPNSEINVPFVAGDLSTARRFKALVSESHVSLSELAPFVPQFKGVDRSVVFKSTLSGSNKVLNIRNITVKVPTTGSKVLLHSPSDISLSANGNLNFSLSSLLWKVNVNLLAINATGLRNAENKIPDALTKFKALKFNGFIGGYGKKMDVKGNILSDAGNAKVDIHKNGDDIKAHLQASSFNLAQILDDNRFGLLSANVNAKGNIKKKHITTKGSIDHFDFNQYPYHGIDFDGSFIDGVVNSKIFSSDPNLSAEIAGSVDIQSKEKAIKVNANINNLAPSKLKIFKGRLSAANYAGIINANLRGKDINSSFGHLLLSKFTMKSANIDYSLDSLRIQTGGSLQGHYIGMRSDFGDAIVYGRFNYANLPQVIKNAIVSKLPSITNLLPFKYEPLVDNFSVIANINRSDWAHAFFDMPLDIRDTLQLSATISDNGKSLNASISAPDLIYSDHHLRKVKAIVKTINDQLHANVSLTNIRNEFVGTDLNLSALAGNDRLQATLSVDNHAKKDRLRGAISSFISFRKDAERNTLAELNVQKSNFSIGDTLFEIHPSTVVYSKNRLAVNSFSITSGNQSLLLDGVASQYSTDSITAIMHNINVNYVLDLVNFHSVDFSGDASGTAHISQIFSNPTANSQLRVNNFRFMNGRLGTLHANVNWNSNESQIDIDAIANDTIAGKQPKPRYTFVKGYISPKRNYIDLGIKLKDTRAELVEGLCSSFLKDMDLTGNGDLRVWGDLKKINLTGKVLAHGAVTVSPLGARYSIPHALVNFTENEILFANDSIYDSNGNIGIIEGAMHHQHLGHMTYDLNVEAKKLLAFNFDGSDGSSFYGKVFGTGNASIKGRSGEVDIDVNMRPESNSEIVYDISSPESIGSQDFIQWESRDGMDDSAIKPVSSILDSASIEAKANLKKHYNTSIQAPDIGTDIRLNFLIDANPNATLRLIMDRTSGDYITLNGTGTLRATYFNKGGVDIFGTYTVDHGVYRLTIQNIIKRVFEFTQGGAIVFGGDPYNAILNLKAQYPIASVSLSDLQVGRSFSSNNIRVNCLMDISGTPASPRVGFNLDFPTLSQDQQQMISSVINGEEEMNQQVLYLLAVGRFYSRGTNNAGTQSYNQTSLAMQSILSGELSQQINNVLGAVMKNDDWNFGANISTGDEGWNNAEYEGLLSGRLLNNRLLLNGQFGYRDNANTTQSFIGDFDVRYLIVPSGNFSVHVYNKTNDRYFTRNSLNTQGIGFILKKDFSSLRDLFRLKKK